MIKKTAAENFLERFFISGVNSFLIFFMLCGAFIVFLWIYGIIVGVFRMDIAPEDASVIQCEKSGGYAETVYSESEKMYVLEKCIFYNDNIKPDN